MASETTSLDRVQLERAAVALYDGLARYQEATGPNTRVAHWNQLPWGTRQQYVAAARVVVDVYSGHGAPSGPRPRRWLPGARRPRLRRRQRDLLEALGASGFPGRTIVELAEELAVTEADAEAAVRGLVDARLVYLPLGTAIAAPGPRGRPGLPWLPTDDGYRVLEAR